MASANRAWVMDAGGGYRVAVGGSYMVEYLVAPEPIHVPRAPQHCAGLLVWRDCLIPVIDLAPLLPSPAADRRPRAVILAYPATRAEPAGYGALLVDRAPVEVPVTDDMACPLPEDAPVLGQFSRSCFALEERAVPILDTAWLFARPLRPVSPIAAIGTSEAPWFTDAAGPLGGGGAGTSGAIADQDAGPGAERQ